MRNHIFVYFFFLILGGCVSVQLPGGKVTPAKDVEFQPPTAPFKEIKTANSDKTWLSGKTGNTISFLSECGGNSDPSLEQIESDSLSAMSHTQNLKTEELSYNGRAARQTVSKGTLDGVSVQMRLLVFKKNGCNYTLSFGGLENRFSSEEKYFETFLKGFKAP